MPKRLVDDVQHLTAILFLAKHLTALGVHRMQIIPFHHHFGHLAELFRHTLLGHNELEFHIVVVFLPAAHLLNMLRIVRIVIDGCHCTQFLKTLDEHTLWVHICKAQRTNHLRHAFRATPLCHSLQQGFRHLNVVDKVYPSKTYAVALPLFVGTTVNDSGNASYNLSILISQKVFGLTKLEGCIFVLAQGVNLVRIQVWSIVGIAAIQIVVELYKGIQLFLSGNFANLN